MPFQPRREQREAVFGPHPLLHRLSDQLTFNAGTILLGGTVTSGTCDFNGTAGGSYAAPNVSGTIASIAAGAASTLVFRATVN